MSVIGIVRLAPGQVGYFDDITRIHLTIASPEKQVTSGMNTTNLKRAVKSKSILLISGNLDPEPVKVEQTVPVTPVVPQPAKVEPVVQEQAKVEVPEVKEESGVVNIEVPKKEEAPVETPVEETESVTESAPESVESVEDASSNETDAEKAAPKKSNKKK
jgi:hypothetical protein